MVEFFNRRGQGTLAAAWNYKPIQTIHHHVTRFACSYLRKAARGGVVSYFRATFTGRRKDVYARVPVPGFGIRDIAGQLDVGSREPGKARLDFVMDCADQHQLGVLEIERMPHVQPEVDALAFDERADIDRAKKVRRLAGSESRHIGPARQLVQLVAAHARGEKGFGCT